MSNSNYSSRQKQNRTNAKKFAVDIQMRIIELFEQQKIDVSHKNKEKQRQAQSTRKKISFKQNKKHEQTFYKYMQDCTERLRLVNKKITKLDKKVVNYELYTHWITLLINHLTQIYEQRSVNLSIDEKLIKIVKQSDEAFEQCDKWLASFEKQNNKFCVCGSNQKQVKKQLEKSLIRLMGYYQFWMFLDKLEPVVHKQIMEQYLSMEYEETVFNDIEKLIASLWPDVQRIQVPIEKVVEKVVYQQNSLKSQSRVSSEIMDLQKEEIKSQLGSIIERHKMLEQQFEKQKQLRQAHQLLIGLGRTPNPQKALQIYKLIPEMESSMHQEQSELRINSGVCNIMGSLYEQGKYVPKDMKKSIQYYIKSASVEDPEGMYKIAKYLEKNMINSKQLFNTENGGSSSQGIRDAIQHYEKAASKGHLDAITDLGHIYENGIRKGKKRGQNSSVIDSRRKDKDEYIIQPNLDIALKYYSKAKKQEFPRALNNIGSFYIRLHNQIPETIKGANIQKGLKYLKRAVQLKYPKSYLNLGKCYENGIGVKASQIKAKNLYLQGSQKGDSQSKIEFVKCTINDTIQSHQEHKLIQCLRQIIVQEPDNQQGLYLMGLFHEKGIGVEKNPQLAFSYMSKSAKLEHPPAQLKVGDYYYSGYFVHKSLQKSRQFYQRAALSGNSQSFINLGLMYEKKLIDLPPSQSASNHLSVAKNYYLLAAKMGNSNALIFVNAMKGQQYTERNMREIAELGSQQAVKILAKTNSTFENQIKSTKKVGKQYDTLMKKYVKEAHFDKKLQGRKQGKGLKSPPSYRKPAYQQSGKNFIRSRESGLSPAYYSPRSSSRKDSKYTLMKNKSSEYFDKNYSSKEYYNQ